MVDNIKGVRCTPGQAGMDDLETRGRRPAISQLKPSSIWSTQITGKIPRGWKWSVAMRSVTWCRGAAFMRVQQNLSQLTNYPDKRKFPTIEVECPIPTGNRTVLHGDYPSAIF